MKPAGIASAVTCFLASKGTGAHDIIVLYYYIFKKKEEEEEENKNYWVAMTSSVPVRKMINTGETIS
jgi:hypothetical protein